QASERASSVCCCTDDDQLLRAHSSIQCATQKAYYIFTASLLRDKKLPSRLDVACLLPAALLSPSCAMMSPSSMLMDTSSFANNSPNARSPQTMPPLLLNANGPVNNSCSPPSSLQSLCSNVSSSGNETNSQNKPPRSTDNLLVDVDDTMESPSKFLPPAADNSNGVFKLALNVMNGLLKQNPSATLFNQLNKRGGFVATSSSGQHAPPSQYVGPIMSPGRGRRRIGLEDASRHEPPCKYTMQGASYKNLTWREKDRRRRFRDEWKHTWLVIPEGKFEVKCLVCHKVMTQRKLDTIKRHTTRKHNELMSMSDRERQNLFDQLFAFHQQICTGLDQSAESIQENSNKSINIFHTALMRLGIPIEHKQSAAAASLNPDKFTTVGHGRGRGKLSRLMVPPNKIGAAAILSHSPIK
ncbi:hypothetical protein Ciccas_008127, partial [Cichlidogyrus casuarinus]